MNGPSGAGIPTDGCLSSRLLCHDRSALHSQYMGDGLTDVGRILNHVNTGSLHGSDLFLRCAFAAGNDGASVSHASSGRSGSTGNESEYRLGDPLFDHVRRLFFGCAADLTDHHDGVCLFILFKQGQRINEVGAVNGIAADTDAGGLTQSPFGQLPDSLVSQRAAA